MKKFLGTTAIALVVGFSLPAYAATSEEDCIAMFEKIEIDDNSWIDGDVAKPYLVAIKKAGIKRADGNKDGKLNADEFVKACQTGAFKDIPVKVMEDKDKKDD